MVSEQEKTRLLQAVRKAAEKMDAAALERVSGRVERGQAIIAAEAAGIQREEIAEAAGLKWPMTRARWSQLRRGEHR